MDGNRPRANCALGKNLLFGRSNVAINLPFGNPTRLKGTVYENKLEGNSLVTNTFVPPEMTFWSLLTGENGVWTPAYAA